jgi:hypothetical protein
LKKVPASLLLGREARLADPATGGTADAQEPKEPQRRRGRGVLERKPLECSPTTEPEVMRGSGAERRRNSREKEKTHRKKSSKSCVRPRG